MMVILGHPGHPGHPDHPGQPNRPGPPGHHIGSTGPSVSPFRDFFSSLPLHNKYLFLNFSPF